MITVAEEVERAVQLATNCQQSLISADLNQSVVDQQNLASSRPSHKPVNHRSWVSGDLNQLLVAVNETDCIILSSDEEERVHDGNMEGLTVKRKAKVLPDKKITLKKGSGGKRIKDSSSEEKFLKSKVRKEKKSKDENENLMQLKAQPLHSFPSQSSMGTSTYPKHQHQPSNQQEDIASVTTDPPSSLSASSSHQQHGGAAPHLSKFNRARGEAVVEESLRAPGIANHQGRLLEEANASPDLQVAFPSAGSDNRLIAPPLHSEKPMLSGSNFDGSLVLCEEVRVKIEGLDTGVEETQDPLICELDVCEFGGRTGGNEGGKHAARIKDCRVMLKRKIVDKESPWRAGDHIRLGNWGKGTLGFKMGDDKRFGPQGPGNHKIGVVCNECGNRFVNDRTLIVHKKWMHQGEPRNQKCECKIVGCESPFFSKGTRGVHMRMVHGQPKLKCQFDKCDSEFYSSQGLKRHMYKKH